MAQTSKEQELTALREKYVPKGPSNLSPYFAEEAKGAIIRDVAGRELIDFAGGIGVMNVGHCNPRVVAALKDQADKYLHTCFNVVMYEPYVRLAQKLCEAAPGDFPRKVVLTNSGAEAVENAVKTARHFTGRQAVICMANAFHGRTLLTMTMTSKVKPYKFGFGPFAPEVYKLPYAYCYRCPMGLEHPSCSVACADALKEFFVGSVAAENVACVVAEPIQGEGGFVTPPKEYFTKLADICRANGILFVADEVQTGFGRTGKLFAMEHFDVAADIICVAKSIAAGLPLSGIVGRAEIMENPQSGGLGGTYGGNPMACRAGLAVFEAFEKDGLLEKARRVGEIVRGRFESWKNTFELVGDVRGLGAMQAVELVTDRKTKTPATAQTKAWCAYCVERGLLLLNCGNFGNVVRTLMPLVITEEQLERGLSIMEKGLDAVSAGKGV